MRITLIIFSLLIFVGCANEEPKLAVFQGEAFGTTYGIQVYGDNPITLQKGIDSVIYVVNKSVSTYLPKSDISKINAGDSTLVVDAIFKEVFVISEEVHKNSHGYFDPTIGVLRNAYGFGSEKAMAKIDETVVDSLMQYVGFNKVSITSEGTVKKDYPEIYFDFNAVAKGYGIDCIGRYFEAQGINDYLIELGGEVLAKGENRRKEKIWTAGVEAVDSGLEDRTSTVVIQLKNKAMAGSGNYRKFRVDSSTGKKYVHTINPLTGLAFENDVTSATVLAPTCGVADAYATACMALGVEKARKMIEATPGVEAYLTYTDSLNSDQVYISEGFRSEIIE